MKTLKMKLKSMQFGLVAIGIVALFFTSCNKDDVVEEIGTQPTQSLITDSDEAEAIFSQLVKKENGDYVLSETDPLKLGIDPDLFSNMSEHFEYVKKMIANGELREDEIGIEQALDIEGSLIGAKKCGENSVSTWWGSTTLRLNRELNLKIIKHGCSALSRAPGTWGKVAKSICASAKLAEKLNLGCSCGVKIKFWNVPTVFGLRSIDCQHS